MSLLNSFNRLSCGLRGPAIEPLVPLLTFIGSLELDKEIENQVNNKTNQENPEFIPSSSQRSPVTFTPKKKKTKGLGK